MTGGQTISDDEIENLEILIFDYRFKFRHARALQSLPRNFEEELDALHEDEVDLVQKAHHARYLSVLAHTLGAEAQVLSQRATLAGKLAGAGGHLSRAYHNWFLAGLYLEAALQMEAGKDISLGQLRASRGDIQRPVARKRQTPS
jgi:hypothetical protein